MEIIFLSIITTLMIFAFAFALATIFGICSKD